MDDVAEAFGFRWAYGARCSAYFKGLDSPFKFYKKSIELLDKYNMDVILHESNIIPGNNYTFQAIADAVSKGLQGTEADIECSRGFVSQFFIYSFIFLYIYEFEISVIIFFVLGGENLRPDFYKNLLRSVF